jgi:chromosome segregation ATPase
MRDRQMKKHEQKMDDEIHKQVELKREMEALVFDMKRLQGSKEAVEQTYSVLEDKLHMTEELLDQRTTTCDQQQRAMTEMDNKIMFLENELENFRQQLDEKSKEYESVTFENNKLSMLQSQREEDNDRIQAQY